MKPSKIDPLAQFEQRKQDHIQLALKSENEALGYSGIDRLQLIHEALPDLNFDDITLTTKRFKQSAPSPYFVSSMTAGHRDANKINQVLAASCAHSQWAMGVGSQRRQLIEGSVSDEWIAIRKNHPTLSLFGNIGIAQLIETPIDKIQRLIDSLNATAMIIHCNPLQECLQPEGTPNFSGGVKAIETLCRALSIPVVVKETGCGFSSNTLKRLCNIGVSAVDVSGFGGTHWGRIEGQRASDSDWQSTAANTFKNWGVSTIDSLKNAKALEPDFELWGSGGVRSGLDAAKLIALGASSIGLAKPMLQAALKSEADVIQLMQQLEKELKVAMFCTGSLTIDNLQENKICQ